MQNNASMPSADDLVAALQRTGIPVEVRFADRFEVLGIPVRSERLPGSRRTPASCP
jgi:hypothetical protein